MDTRERTSRMARASGQASSPLWLLGDSEPANFCDRLDVPLDRRHPARHSIWTPILDVIQEHAFHECRARLDDRALYIRNAVRSPRTKPGPGEADWQGMVLSDIGEFRKLLDDHTPRLVLCFGAFAWEFACRAQGRGPARAHGKWGAKELGERFKERIQDFSPSQVNIVPLLHASIARGRFLESHRDFCGSSKLNYFDVVGGRLAEVLLQHRDLFKRVWLS